MNETSHEQLVDLLVTSNRILVFTGAGISTGSGIPDYRGPKGIWKTRAPVYYQDFMSREESRVTYWENKMLDWEDFRDAKPNPVHSAIARLEKAQKIELVVTQNIDGLHEKGGTSRSLLTELHGTNSLIECQTCNEMSDPDPHFAVFRETRRAPLCQCGGYLKPATISFGQDLRQEDLARAFDSARRADLALSLGSTLSVHPAASVPLTAAERGVPYVVINQGATEHDGLAELTLRFEGDVGAILPKAVDEALRREGKE